MIGASMPRSCAMRAAIAAVATPSASGRPGKRLAAPEREPVGEIARLRRCAGEQQVAEAGQAPSASRARAPKAAPMRRNSTKPRVTMAACALAPSPAPVTAPGGDRKDVLQRAADLDADEVAGRIAAEAARSKSARQAPPPAPRRARRRPPPSAGPAPRRSRSSDRTAPRPDCPGRISSAISRQQLARSRARCPWRRAPAARRSEYRPAPRAAPAQRLRRR